MQNLNLKTKTATKSLTSFQEILLEPNSPIIRDAALLRFEQSVEIFWRLLKNYLCVHEGLLCESPGSCMRTAFKVGLMSEAEMVQAIKIIEKREEIENITKNVNFEEVAEEIYHQIGDYWKLMDSVCRRVIENLGSET